jgi:hypothetical protein
MKRFVLFIAAAVAATAVINALPRARGQAVFCANSSHGLTGWEGTCRASSREAAEDSAQHKKDNPSHKDDVTTLACDLP